ncbi:homocysteine S-methyltransferase family protein [Sphingosinicella sp.]|jgi:S-methylmethionine-dependent homocysteine/selenocysteine methylase|uniref:homocysteine S-methyltransferase family protein n=1 Tax=Sphingosinicella sp. TaxID=1917971 RepID=UPI0017A394F0|nr:homocysteine S-methyltransferase family protein [Sphingosinicella sp.]MBA4758684.1 homocysteine S-methyltransferase family protein [Sphingosinicella sp.]
MYNTFKTLPQLADRLFLTDGGLETTLIFHDGIDLPHFAAFDLMRTQEGRRALHAYYLRYLEIAQANGTGFILESPTWRASPDWGVLLGYSEAALAESNRESIALMHELKSAYATDQMPVVVSGCIGPRGDGYVADAIMSTDAARDYHAFQANIFAEACADMVTAITMTNTPEAIGIARAAEAAGLPVALSFTLETDGCLPTGQSLAEAINAVDDATGGFPAYYMINCAHPDHFAAVLKTRGDWTQRVRGLRTNASRMSHAELNEAPELDDGNPDELGAQNAALLRALPALTVLGGCCGTDHRHVGAMCAHALAA